MDLQSDEHLAKCAQLEEDLRHRRELLAIHLAEGDRAAVREMWLLRFAFVFFILAVALVVWVFFL